MCVSLLWLELIVSRWVTGSQAVNGQGHTYNISGSATAKPYPNATFFEGFPQSSISGIVVQDTVTLVNTTAVVANFSFGVVNHKSSGIAYQPFDGFLGLGFSGSGPNRTSEFPWLLHR